jgi:hypothetical protein
MLGLFKKKLPHCDTLFEKYLSPWYDQEDRPTMTRPDMYVISVYNGQPLDLEKIQYLPDDLLAYNQKQLQTMAEAALGDYQHIMQSDTLNLAVLDAVDKYYDRKKIADIISKSDPKDFSNDYLIEVCEFGAMLGHLFARVDGFGWLYAHPYFHSIIVHRDTGMGITVFDWAVKKFSEYGVDDGFAAKFHMALESVKQQQ